MNEPRKRPSPLWLFFYGRRRSGMPWLLAGTLVLVIVLGLTFAIPGGADAWRAVAPILIGGLIGLAIAVAIAAVLWPRRRS